MNEKYKEVRGVLVKKYRNLLGQYIFVIEHKGTKTKIHVGKMIYKETDLNTKWTIGHADGKLINIRPGICNNSFQRKDFDEEMERLFEKAEALIPDEMLPDLPYMEEVLDAHDWYAFEHQLCK